MRLSHQRHWRLPCRQLLRTACFAVPTHLAYPIELCSTPPPRFTDPSKPATATVIPRMF